MATKKVRKAPRVVMLDTRRLADLDGICQALRSEVDLSMQLLDSVKGMMEQCREIFGVICQMHQAQQKRSGAAKKANATRKKEDPAPEDNGNTSPQPESRVEA